MESYFKRAQVRPHLVCGVGVVPHGDENLIVPPPRPHFSSSTPPAHFPNLSGHALPPAPPLSGAQLMLRTVDKNLEAFFAPKKNFMPPPFPLMWSQTHAKVWGQSHCLVAP